MKVCSQHVSKIQAKLHTMTKVMTKDIEKVDMKVYLTLIMTERIKL